MNKKLMIVSVACVIGILLGGFNNTILYGIQYLTSRPGYSYVVGESVDWWNCEWSYSKKITIDHTKIASDQFHYPVLLHQRSDAELALYAQSNGGDIVFVDNFNSTQYYHELELFNPVNGEMIAWVNIPSLSSSADTVLYMYYGNAECEPQWNSTGTWNSGYVMVHHLQETSGPVYDSTGSGIDGTVSGQMSLDAVGKIGSGAFFEGLEGHISFGSHTSLNISGALTVEAWVKDPPIHQLRSIEQSSNLQPSGVEIVDKHHETRSINSDELFKVSRTISHVTGDDVIFAVLCSPGVSIVDILVDSVSVYDDWYTASAALGKNQQRIEDVRMRLHDDISDLATIYYTHPFVCSSKGCVVTIISSVPKQSLVEQGKMSYLVVDSQGRYDVEYTTYWTVLYSDPWWSPMPFLRSIYRFFFGSPPGQDDKIPDTSIRDGEERQLVYTHIKNVTRLIPKHVDIQIDEMGIHFSNDEYLDILLPYSDLLVPQALEKEIYCTLVDYYFDRSAEQIILSSDFMFSASETTSGLEGLSTLQGREDSSSVQLTYNQNNTGLGETLRGHIVFDNESTLYITLRVHYHHVIINYSYVHNNELISSYEDVYSDETPETLPVFYGVYRYHNVSRASLLYDNRYGVAHYANVTVAYPNYKESDVIGLDSYISEVDSLYDDVVAWATKTGDTSTLLDNPLDYHFRTYTVFIESDTLQRFTFQLNSSDTEPVFGIAMWIHYNPVGGGYSKEEMGVPQQYSDYKSRVEADGGNIQNENETINYFNYLLSNDLYDNLMLGITSEAGVKARSSGSDLFVNTAYDLSGEENDAVQTTNENQPKLVSDGLEFDDDWLFCDGESLNIQCFSILLWTKFTDPLSNNNDHCFNRGNTLPGTIAIIKRNTAGSYHITGQIRNHNGDIFIIDSETPAVSDWVFICLTYDESVLKIYINNEEKKSEELNESVDIDNFQGINLGANINLAAKLYGKLNDISIFNKALSPSEISALYNFTKDKYKGTTIPTDFHAATYNPAQINLSWTKGTGATHTYIEYNTSANWTIGKGNEIYNNTGESFIHTGLNPATTYYYRAWSYNSTSNYWTFKSAYSSNKTIPFQVTTLPATGITAVNATLWGYLVDDGGEACTVRFEYGTTTNYGTNTTNQTKTAGESFNFTIAELTPGQLYRYRSYSNNSVGSTNGSDMAFLTKPESPTDLVVLMINSTTLYLSWSPGVGANNTYIEYNFTSPLWERGQGSLLYNDSGASYEHIGLSSGQTVYYQAWSFTNWTYNPTISEISEQNASAMNTTNSLPAISNPVPANESTQVSLTPLMNITVADPNGDTMEIIWYSNTSGDWLEFGRNSSVGNGTYHQVNSNFSEYNTTYYWYVTISDGLDMNTSDVFHFTTEAITIPSVSTLDATGITATNATLHGFLDDDGGEACNVGFEYGLYLHDRVSQEYLDYKSRVEADGGSIQDENATIRFFNYLLDTDLYDNLVLGIDGSAGVKTRISGSDVFVNTAYDMSGEGNDAVQSTEANQPKLVSSGIEFDGSDDCLDVPDNQELRLLSAGTIIAWIRPYSWGGGSFGRVISKGSETSSDEWQVWITDHAGTDQIRIRIGNQNTDSSNNAIVLNQQHFFGGTFDNTSRVIIVNGQDVTSDGGGNTALPFNRANLVRIGGLQGAEREFDGIIGTIFIFNRSLSASEISALYNLTKDKYNHTTTKTSGEYFSENITDLTPGTLYSYNAYANNSAGISRGETKVFLTKPLQITNFTASQYSETQINLTWTKAIGSNNTYIERNTIPTWGRGQGTLIYNDTGTHVEDTQLYPGVTYYYKAWSLTLWTYNPTLYQFSESSANASTETIYANKNIISKTTQAYSLEVNQDATILYGTIKNTTITAPITFEWHHVALTYDGSTMRLYMDGAIVNQTSLSGAIPTNPHPLQAGKFLTGELDEIRISSTARSPNWINTTYRNTVDPESFATFGPQQGVLSTWTYRKLITIDKEITSENLQNFPLLIHTQTDTNLAENADTTGYDIIFMPTDEPWNQGTWKNKLDYEIETYNPTTGELLVWVRIPTLSAAQDTELYMYYGNSLCVTNKQNPTAVWDEHYIMVHHLTESGDGSANEYRDSTSNARHGQGGAGNQSRVPTYTNQGKINGANVFDGIDDFILISDSMLNYSTFSAWIKTQSTDEGVIGAGFLGNSYYVLSVANGRLQIAGAGGEDERVQTSDSVISLDTWHHVVCVDTGEPYPDEFIIYVDGQEQSLQSEGTYRATDKALIGARYYQGNYSIFFNGTLDEIRISNIARSASWINASYQNQNNTAAFITIGPQRTKNTPPTLTNPTPQHQSNTIDITPQLKITITDKDADQLDITFRTNASGSWQNIGTNNSVYNGTYTQYGSMMNQHHTTYYWSVNATDGQDWTNATYQFTTLAAETYYFNNYDTSNTTWEDMSNLIDGQNNTYAYTNQTDTIYHLNSTTFTSIPTEQIQKIQIRIYSSYENETQTASLYLQPIYNNTYGSEYHITLPANTAQWSDWIDITTGLNAPDTWDEEYLLNGNLTLKIKSNIPEQSGEPTIYASKVELKILYIP